MRVYCGEYCKLLRVVKSSRLLVDVHLTEDGGGAYSPPAAAVGAVTDI